VRGSATSDAESAASIKSSSFTLTGVQHGEAERIFFRY
jgi:hypothetical protein